MENLEYNSEKELLIIPEYGRNIQLLIQKAKNIDDLEKKHHYVEQIIRLIQQMHPQARNMEDYTAKLWTHILELNPESSLNAPFTDLQMDKKNEPPQPIPYLQGDAIFKHYGRNIEEMVRMAILMEDLDKKETYIKIIINYMRASYRSWNADSSLPSKVIAGDLKKLSKGLIDLDPAAIPEENPDALRKKRNPSYSRNTKPTSKRKAPASSGRNTRGPGSGSGATRGRSNTGRSNSGYRGRK